KKLATGLDDTTILLWDLVLSPDRTESAAKSPKDLPMNWHRLASQDARQARRAIWALIASPDQTLPFLKRLMWPATEESTKRVRDLIANLDDSKFAVREAAAKALRELGMDAEPAMRQALQNTPSPELRRRLEALLAILPAP